MFITDVESVPNVVNSCAIGSFDEFPVRFLDKMHHRSEVFVSSGFCCDESLSQCPVELPLDNGVSPSSVMIPCTVVRFGTVSVSIDNTSCCVSFSSWFLLDMFISSSIVVMSKFLSDCVHASCFFCVWALLFWNFHSLGDTRFVVVVFYFGLSAFSRPETIVMYFLLLGPCFLFSVFGLFFLSWIHFSHFLTVIVPAALVIFVACSSHWFQNLKCDG